ncbi:MAG: cell division protein FtsZ [Tenacibaculum sp.]|nr:cell division protein FtsZ [Tenacibaculum sp.]
MSAEFDEISFNMPKTQSNAIKVIGVGGGGSNAVNHMYSKQIHGVDFVICNTDSQALENSPIPNKIQLGAHLTSGLGAGANPEIGAQAAAESIQDIENMLGSHTKMVFITAGMGGGTGTGAAPIIAKIAKDMDILTVGIVTMPFAFEGRMRTKQAENGINELRANVDSLIVINNNKLREVYGNLGFKAGFSKADEVLATAAKGIAEVITHHYKQNIDLHDAKTVLSKSGTAIMGSARESGDDRAKNAIINALDSPLLNDNKITGAKNVLLLIVSGTKEVTLDEIGEINDYIQDEAGHEANIIMGVGEDESLEDGIAVTVVATGFPADQQSTIIDANPQITVHSLGDEQESVNKVSKNVNSPLSTNESTLKKEKVVFNLEEQPKLETIEENEVIKKNNILTEEEGDNGIFDDFVITNVTKKEEIIEEEIPVDNGQELLFNFPLKDDNVKSNNLTSTKTVNNNLTLGQEIVVEKRFTLDDSDLKSDINKNSGFSNTNVKIEEEELQFKVSTKPQESVTYTKKNNEEVSPLSLTIAELQSRSEERLQKMKKFNYKFSYKVNENIEEIEREPAFKRKGLDVEVTNEISKTKTILKTDSSDFPLKSNNSFLHDNVD